MFQENRKEIRDPEERSSLPDKLKRADREQGEESYQFVQEKIKERPINKKKLLRRTIITAVMALIFGLVACFTFFWMEPIISNWLYPEEEPEIVTFPEEEVETMPEDMIQTEEEALQAEQEAQQAQQQENEPAVQKQTTIYQKVGLTVEDYMDLYTELSGIAKETSRCMVEVTGVTSDVDWLNDVYDNKDQSAGVIVANNGVELLILAKDSAAGSSQSVVVTFYDGSVNEAVKKRVDSSTGLCILGVDMDHVSEETMSEISVAALGSSSLSNLLAMPVIAIGAPTGVNGSVSYGIITSNSALVRKQDINYRLLTTDIYGSSEATGIIINLKGQVLGIIDNSYNAQGMQNQISAIGITELKRTIEALSNDNQRACLGIYGTDITAALSESLEMPRGVYVESFEMGSPAMICGIQGSDIITAIDDMSINSMSDLTSALGRRKPGDAVTVILQRNVKEEYREMAVEVTLGEMK